MGPYDTFGSGQDPDRTREMVATTADAYFLDVDASGLLFRDHSLHHPMTKFQDRDNRIPKMERIAKDMVLGSETAEAWANKVLAFNHGAAASVGDRL
ncbi:glycoside hydrolase [Streptomyces lavendulae]|uniref:glycoside hydrolase n=1 Tax=Streptomyces lavendulae TaxID=1914 RepID=UPI0036AD0C14